MDFSALFYYNLFILSKYRYVNKLLQTHSQFMLQTWNIHESAELSYFLMVCLLSITKLRCLHNGCGVCCWNIELFRLSLSSLSGYYKVENALLAMGTDEAISKWLRVRDPPEKNSVVL
jgi:hypothetical protein